MIKATRLFHLGDVLSAATGVMLSPRGVEGVYDILNHMTNDNIYTHQIPRAIDECSPYLLNEMPWIKEIDVSGVSSDNFKSWIDDKVKIYGELHQVHTIHFDDHKRIDPVEELNTMAAADSIIVGRPE